MDVLKKAENRLPETGTEGELSNEARDFHRAIEIFKEELDAIDWYDAQLGLCRDPRLQEILVHNQNEERKHAKMIFEWLEERDLAFSIELKKSVLSENAGEERGQAEQSIE